MIKLPLSMLMIVFPLNALAAPIPTNLLELPEGQKSVSLTKLENNIFEGDTIEEYIKEISNLAILAKCQSLKNCPTINSSEIDIADKKSLITPDWKASTTELCSPTDTTTPTTEILEADATTMKIQALNSRSACLAALKKNTDLVATKIATLDYENIDKENFSNTLKDNSQLLSNELESIKGKVDSLDMTKAEKIIAEADGRLSTDEIWFAQLHVGQRFSPLYDEEGNNKGFKQSKFFSEFNLDTRWEFENLKQLKNWISFRPLRKKIGLAQETDFNEGKFALTYGTNIKFYSADIVNCENYADEAQKDKCKQETGVKEIGENSNPAPLDLNFNDVADTIDASLYVTMPFYLNAEKTLDVGPSARLGVQSRDKLKSNGSSLDSYQAVGLKTSYNDFFGDASNAKNGMPRFDLEYLHVWADDYGNLGENKSRRHIIQGKYRIMEKSPLYLGLVVNRGKGPDEIALSMSWGINIENVISRF